MTIPAEPNPSDNTAMYLWSY